MARIIQTQCSLDLSVSCWQVSTWLWNAGEGGVWAWMLSKCVQLACPTVTKSASSHVITEVRLWLIWQTALPSQVNRHPCFTTSPHNQKHLPNDSKCLHAVPKHACKTLGDNVAGLWAGTVTEPGCRKQSKPLPENSDVRMGEELWPALNSPPLFWAGQRVMLWPGHLCFSARLGDPCLASQDTSKNPPSPSGDLGLSCQGPATQTAPLGQGRNSERSRRVKESKNTFF